MASDELEGRLAARELASVVALEGLRLNPGYARLAVDQCPLGEVEAARERHEEASPQAPFVGLTFLLKLLFQATVRTSI